MDCIPALCAVTTMTFEIRRFGQGVNSSGGGPELVMGVLECGSSRGQAGCW
jgi:hypothetical protein